MAYEVKLAVYDLSRGMARQMSAALLGKQIDGIWHTGIVVYGREYYFGGGIQVTPYGQFTQANGLPPSELLSLGTTQKTQSEFEAHIRTLSASYTQHTYNLITNNCNHFADVLSRYLLGGVGIPTHIVDLPRIVFSTPGGAMLRPMVEAMQRNIHQQYGTAMDPFAGNITATSSSSSVTSQGAGFESALSQSVASLAMNALQNQSSSTQGAQTSVASSASISVSTTERERETKRAKTVAALAEQPLVSADDSSLSLIEKKLLALASLSDDERERLRNVLLRLREREGESGARCAVEDYLLVERLLAAHSEAHTFLLSLLRLMFLHDKASDWERLSLVRAVLQRLLSRRGDGSLEMQHKDAQSAADGGFASVPAHVMALCAMANLLSHDAGAAFVLGGEERKTARESERESESADDAEREREGEKAKVLDDLVDVVLAGFAHSRAEVRRMSAALAVNLSLAWQRESAKSGVATVEELNPHTLQLLCGCCEGIQDETDLVVRERRLSTVCRIARSAPAAVKSLLSDLGFTDAMYALISQHGEQSSLTAQERAIVDEMLHLCE